MAKQNREGFTLVELLVVITIIGILASLLLAAVTSAQESARRVQCQNNLKNIALAAKAHMAEHGYYPTGGWGKGREGSSWAGDPDRGFSRRQPGGWCYNILPYIGQGRIHDLGEGEGSEDTGAASDTAVRTPLNFLSCPKRRPTRAYPYTRNEGYKNVSISKGTQVGKTDYAMCAGTKLPSSAQEPSGLSEVDNGSFNWSTLSQNGVSYYCSEVKHSHIEDGESNQYMVGEKYLRTIYYETGTDPTDDESWNVGFTYDIYRWALAEPRMDKPNRVYENAFGGPHPSGWQVAFCDGSVHSIAWGIEIKTHRRLGSRNDGEPVDSSTF